MGKVKTEQVKHVAKELVAKYPDKFSTNFDDNKHMVSQLTQGTTTRVRNQIAGCITRALTLEQKPRSGGEEEIEDMEE